MTDASLQIKVSTQGATQATGQLNNLAKAGGRAERASDGLMGSIGRLAGSLAIAATAGAALNKLVSTQRSFDVINAGLITATGSAENAAHAFEAIQEFATATPYSLEEASNAFTKLVNYGLTPSEKALTSYGNTASALGKDLGQMIEAVADAATGEFERLKEFGIKASSEGDRVKLTFRGVTQEVGKNAGEIEDYLIALGENNFGDAMSNRMATLDGALANLADEWDSLFRNVSNSGIGDAVTASVDLALDALGSINEWITSGELEASLAYAGRLFGPWAEDAVEAVDIVQQALNDLTSWLNTEYPEDMQILSDAWNDFPANIRAVIQIAAVHVAWFVQTVSDAAAEVEGYWDAMADGWGGLTMEDAYNKSVAAAARNKANLNDSIDLIFAERDATKQAAETAHAAALQKAADAKREADARREALGGLGRYGVDRPTTPATDDKGNQGEAKKRAKEFAALVDSLRTEEEALQVSYDRQRAIIEANTSAESEMRTELSRRLEAWRDEEAQDISEAKNRELRQIEESLMTEEEAIRASYDRRKQVVLDSMEPGEAQTKLLDRLRREHDLEVAYEEQSRQARRDRLFQDFLSEDELRAQFRDKRVEEQRRAYDEDLISWEEFQRNKALIEEQYSKQVQDNLRAQQTQTMGMYAGLFGSLSDLAGQFAKGQGKDAERMFKIQKALAYGQAVMSTAAGISRALADHAAPASYAYAAIAAAEGAAQVAAISQQQFAGAYDAGGRIPAGQFGIVGEKGMEFVQGPANVTSRQETARLLKNQGEGTTITNNVTIQVSIDGDGNATSSTSSRSQGSDASTIEDARTMGKLIDQRVRDVLLKEQRQGGILHKAG